VHMGGCQSFGRYLRGENECDEKNSATGLKSVLFVRIEEPPTDRHGIGHELQEASLSGKRNDLVSSDTKVAPFTSTISLQ
jgi:hypothetical protein